MPNIALNGLGGIGKLALRDLVSTGAGGKMVLLNDPVGDAAQHALLMNFDSVHGRWQGQAVAGVGTLTLDGQDIPLTYHKQIEHLPLADMGVDVVVDATGVFKTATKVQPHFDAGVQKVIVTAPVKDGGR